MMPNTQNVTFGKPKVGGAIYSAPLGTALPKDAVSELDSAFKDLGYVSEDGVTNTNTPEAEEIKAWGGDTVATANSGSTDTYSMKLIEFTNLDTLKEVYGADNVTGTLEDMITIKANSQDLQDHSMVIDMILHGDTAYRLVLPDVKVTEKGDITYTDSGLAGFELTLTAYPDEEGNTHYGYMQKAKGKAEGDGR